MTLQDILTSVQNRLQNVGQNIQQGNAPLPIVPTPTDLELKELELLNKRANLAQQNRNIEQKYNDNMNLYKKENNFIPQKKPITLDELKNNQIKQIANVQSNPDRILDVGKYQGVSPTEIPLPTQDIQDMLWRQMPNEATQAAVAISGENPSWNPMAKNEQNTDNSIDYALAQNNSVTLEDLFKRQQYAAELKANGINGPEDLMGDPEKSIIATRITRQYEEAAGAEPWSWWFGWQNKGYNMFPDRDIKDVAGTTYKSGNKPYPKLYERLNR